MCGCGEREGGEERMTVGEARVGRNVCEKRKKRQMREIWARQNNERNWKEVNVTSTSA